MADGTLVSVLVDELFELVQESGQPRLYLDFAEISQIASVVIGKLIALNARLREQGGRLILLEMNLVPYEAMQATRLTDALDIRVKEAAETIY
jgi:anti-anti-sigma regulatory factor